MVKKTWSYTRYTKNTCKTIFIGEFIFKKYENNSKDNKALTKTNISIPRLEALTLTIYSPNIYNIFISL